jgi:hypothetical protein
MCQAGAIKNENIAYSLGHALVTSVVLFYIEEHRSGPGYLVIEWSTKVEPLCYSVRENIITIYGEHVSGPCDKVFVRTDTR